MTSSPNLLRTAAEHVRIAEAGRGRSALGQLPAGRGTRQEFDVCSKAYVNRENSVRSSMCLSSKRRAVLVTTNRNPNGVPAC